MNERYNRARQVSAATIATELGWSRRQAVRRLKKYAWLTDSYYVTKGQYNAGVIGVFQMLYGTTPATTSEERDFLAHYLQGDLDA